MYLEPTAQLAIYAPGEFGGNSSKTAEGVLRYGVNPIACVIDATKSGQSIKELTGINCNAPIVASIAEAKELGAEALLLGTAWAGGAMPPVWREEIKLALRAGMDIVNGLHDFLEDDLSIVEEAKRQGKRLFDVRKSPAGLPIAQCRVLKSPAHVVLTVGDDCSVGKMTVSLEIQKSALNAGQPCEFVATGQTGIMICGHGIAIDRVIGDFMAGATEQLVLESAQRAELVIVEGQGSLDHPGFSGVTLALLHGACPQTLIFCSKPSRKTHKGTQIALNNMPRLIATYESMAAYMRPAKVVGIALNTSDLSEEQAREVINKAELETGLPATDPVRFSADKLYEAIVAHSKWLKRGITSGNER